MKTYWDEIWGLAACLTDDPRARARIANLAIAASVAARRGRLEGTPERPEAPALRDAVTRLALSSLPPLPADAPAWDGIAERAAAAADQELSARDVDAWVAAFQGSDPARKNRGAYATPAALARELARAAVAPLGGRVVRVVDPGAGCGALLLAAAEALASVHGPDDRVRQAHSLYGVEIDPVARELCCLLVWLVSPPGAELGRIARNVVSDNALTREWWQGGGASFDVLVMNPPWESLRHEAADGSTESDTRTSRERLRATRTGAEGLPPLFTAQGTGDRNLYKAFLELAPHLVRDGGRIGALVPAAFASDLGTAPLRAFYLDRLSLERWTSFENRAGLFPIDGRYKFGILTGTRSDAGTRSLQVRSFATRPAEVQSDHLELTRQELERLGGPSGMFPEVESRTRMRILLQALHTGTPFFQAGALGRIEYIREVDLTLGRHAGLFTRVENRPDLRPQPDGTFLAADESVWAPLIEGRMVGQYDFFQKSWVSGSGRRARWEFNAARALSECRPQFVTPIRPADPLDPSLGARLAICDVTAATNTRTVHATWVPSRWTCGNTAPVLRFESEELAFAGLAVLNSMVFDWLARRVVAGLHLNKFYLAALPWPALSAAAVRRLSHAGLVLASLTPRFSGAAGPKVVQGCAYGDDRVSIHAGIEREVAEGYSLSREMLAEVFDSDRNDRRGFWRYFAADAHARAIAERALGDDLRNAIPRRMSV